MADINETVLWEDFHALRDSAERYLDVRGDGVNAGGNPNDLRQTAYKLRAVAENVDKLDNPDMDTKHMGREARQMASGLSALALSVEKDEARAMAGPGRNVSSGRPGLGGHHADAIDLLGNGRAVRMADLLATDDDNLDDGGFRGLGDMLNAIRNQAAGVKADARLDKFYATQTGSSDPYGGFLLPDLYQKQIITSGGSDEEWLGQLDRYVVPNGQGREVVTPQISDRTRSGKDVAGVSLTRTTEATTIPTSTITFTSRTAKLTKAATLIYASNELLVDSAVGFSQMLNGIVGQAVAQRRALDFFSGTGVGEPQGVLSASCLYTQAKETNQAADTVMHANLGHMWERMTNASRSRSIWVAHSSVYHQLTTLSIPVGTGGGHVMAFDSNSGRLMGRPIFFSEGAKTLGNVGDITLIDPLSYRYIYKPVIIDVSRHVSFSDDRSVFKAVLRDDGAPIYNSNRTDAQGYEQAEFVTLAERA